MPKTDVMDQFHNNLLFKLYFFNEDDWPCSNRALTLIQLGGSKMLLIETLTQMEFNFVYQSLAGIARNTPFAAGLSGGIAIILTYDNKKTMKTMKASNASFSKCQSVNNNNTKGRFWSCRSWL